VTISTAASLMTATTVSTMLATVTRTISTATPFGTIPRLVFPTVHVASDWANNRGSEMGREHVDLDDGVLDVGE
jgi:hypothetical protein